MRAFCTVSAPLEVCAPPTRPLSPGSRFLALRLLGIPQPRTLYFLVEAKSRVREVYAQTCLHFAKQGMQDTELFGLAVLIDGEYMFADPESKLSKYGPKSWRSSHTHGLDANGRPLLELHFRVQFYIESPFILRDETSRHNYYLQLKANVASRDVPKEYSEQSMVLLGGLALQADFGDCPDDDAGQLISIASGSSMATGNTGTLKTNSIGKGISGNGGSIINKSSCNKSHSNGADGAGSSSSLSSATPLAATSTTPQDNRITTSNINSNSSNNTNSTSSIGNKLNTATVPPSGTAMPSIAPVIGTTKSSLCMVGDYFRCDEYIPVSIRSTWGANALRSCHRENRGMTRSVAELNYIRQACALYDAINAHVYRMKLTKNEAGSGSVWIIVYAKGIKIYGENTQPITFLWPNIIKLSFERKKFEIRSGDNKITLYSASDEKNKMLLTLCKETHQFSMKIAARLKEAKKREEEESDCLHTCYIYSRSLNLPYKNKNDQRISVISSTSSNTTSGIVSDRVHSEDELEIMINSPPAVPIAAPSTESLALAHLLDRPSVSRQTSSVGQVSLKDLEDQLAAALSVRSISSESTGDHNSDRLRVGNDSNETDSPNSQHNIGSQCSSTCSTVVVATDTITLSSLTAHTTTAIRRPSTSSSLELGFSHTAQNSILSEGASICIDHEFISVNDNEAESLSGVYTLAHAPPTETSGVYTMNSSDMTGQSSEIAESESHDSSHYGSFKPKNEIGDNRMVENIDSVDGKYRNRIENEDIGNFRLRSDSNVSGSGSFRGDGSDPTDNKHTLLSAEELTDLIVGRGTYPSRKTVSNTLDSDCDYVTLPIPLEGDSYLQGHEDTAPTEDNDDIDDLLPSNPPAPPKRIDSNVHRSLSSLVDIRTRSPPPYHSRHEKTGLCGPPIRKEPQIIMPLGEPPPYPVQQPRTKSKSNSRLPIYPNTIVPTTLASPVLLPEEVTARFITTRPQISILKAHTSVINETPKPSYTASTIPPPTTIHPHAASQPQIQPHLTQVPSTIGIPIVPYNFHTTRRSMSAIPPPPPPYPEVKPPPRTCVLLPVIKPRQYLPPPPPTLPRQPPPPPPPQLATVYTSQLARSQIELYQQQLYSDVDYVIYPLQDPAVSQQEYLDAKQGSILAAMAQSPPPPPYLAYHTANAHTSTWDACKGHAIYRSTPYLPLALSAHSRYASTQNLSDTYVQLPSAYSSLYSPSVASLCSSYEPPPPPPLRPTTLPTASTMFARSRSDDNILNSIESMPKIKRLPPPPPPPHQYRRTKKPPMPEPIEKPPPPIPNKPIAPTLNAICNNTILSATVNHNINFGTNLSSVAHSPHRIQHQTQTSASSGELTSGGGVSTIDIQVLREKSKHMDLPLISALCNDRSLLKQTKAFVMPKHPRPTSNNSLSSIASTKSKYPVSGLSTNQLTKPRKTSVSHRHPNDKLPPLPVQTAEANNYVMDPTPASIKHKNFNSQSNA